MFGKAREQLEFVKKAKAVQKKLKKEIVEGESGDVKITMNGEMKVQTVEITTDTIEDKDKLERDIKQAMDSVTDKAQKVAANMMKEITGGNLPF